jgi:thiamine pyrophosphate-dependent acetolactate synthase large subunit-like protein
MRAYKIATTPPMGPVMITLDGHLQEMEVGDNRPNIPEFRPTVPSQGETGALREVARMLVNAERPVIMAGSMARTPEGMENLVELAELLQIPVSAGGGRMNFPNDHHLYQSGRLVRQADVVLGLEVGSFWRTVWSMRDLVHRETQRVVSPDVKLISLGLNDVYLKANYQNFQRYQPVDLSIAGDAQASLPALIEEVKRAMTAQRRSQNAAREDEFRRSHQESRTQARKQAAYGWNSSPVSTTRLMIELGQQIKDHDWSLVGQKLTGGARRFWTMNKHYQYIGGSGAGGLGYGAPASIGAALANREHGRLSVSVVADGDFMYSSGALWTATHHDIPLLMVINNNRAYHQEVMHLQRIATRRQRGADGGAKVGNTFEDPFIDYATLAKSYSVWSTGPISDPAELEPALKRAVDVVANGEPALVDVVCQPR